MCIAVYIFDVDSETNMCILLPIYVCIRIATNMYVCIYRYREVYCNLRSYNVIRYASKYVCAHACVYVKIYTDRYTHVDLLYTYIYYTCTSTSTST